MTGTAPTQVKQGVRHRPQRLEGASLGTSSSQSTLNSLCGLSVIVGILFPVPLALYRVWLGWTDGLPVHYHHNLICIVVLADTKYQVFRGQPLLPKGQSCTSLSERYATGLCCQTIPLVKQTGPGCSPCRAKLSPRFLPTISQST